MNRKIILPLFLLVVLAQLFVPAKMIYDSQDTINGGTPYKFRTRPVDPNDPFRGKYITLRFEGTTVSVDDEEEWTHGEEAYALLGTDSKGYARIRSLSKTRPTNGDFITVEVDHVSINIENKVTVKFPFTRFYMEESKAPEAEQLYRDAAREEGSETYALVYVKQGKALVTQVYINDVPLLEGLENSKVKDEE